MKKKKANNKIKRCSGLLAQTPNKDVKYMETQRTTYARLSIYNSNYSHKAINHI